MTMCLACDEGPAVTDDLCQECYKDRDRANRLHKARRDRKERDGAIPSLIRGTIGKRYEGSTLENVEMPDGWKDRMCTAIENGESMILMGENGTGKTHAACGLFRLAFIRCTTLFVLVPDLFGKLRASMDGEGLDEVIKRYRKLDCLILDDLGAEKPTEWVIEQLCRILDWRYRDDAQTIFTTNLGFKDIADIYGDRVRSRIVGLVGANVFKFTGRDRREDKARKQP